MEDFLAGLPDPERLGLPQFLQALAAHPERVSEIQQRYYREQLALWSRIMQAGVGTGQAPPADRRFAAVEWQRLPYFRLLQESYLLHARWLQELVEAAQLPPPIGARLAFALRQYLDAVAPSNFPASNPEVLQLAARTGGASIAAGLRNLHQDAARGRVQMSDERAFAVGRNLAITPGAVVYENPVAQVIQYSPRTPAAHARPLLIVPPFINKYYI
ncbi:MAG: class I poly(R)-hydroxyalkanoic acid synthase, partial [Parvularculaceae bacterium]|nr:class I poly(R)-hydroxyalkanoic acid synthase [Parvularculaceae bacterium]